jgi:hypothetical protein
MVQFTDFPLIRLDSAYESPPGVAMRERSLLVRSRRLRARELESVEARGSNTTHYKTVPDWSTV